MRFVVILFCSAMSTYAMAEERFYTTVDAQGRIQVIKGEESAIPKAKSSVSKEELSSHQDLEQLPKKKLPTELEQGTRQLGSETYIDTELLEKKNFNLQDKKRFYYLPDGGLGTQVIESKDGVVSNPPPIKEVVKPVAYVSNNYMLISKESIAAWYPQQNTCVKPLSIKKKSKPFKDVNNIWVQPSFIPNTFEMDAFLSFSAQAPALKLLRVVSFAHTHKNASFYLPVVVFLDNKGCTLSGAWQYWSRAHSATETQYASVDGLVPVPEKSAFVVIYRPNNTLKADIPLSPELGSFVIEAY